jgi:hypothetical protein
MSNALTITITLSEYNRLIASDKALHEGKKVFVNQYPCYNGSTQAYYDNVQEHLTSEREIIQLLSDYVGKQNNEIARIGKEKSAMYADLCKIIKCNWFEFRVWRSINRDKY